MTTDRRTIRVEIADRVALVTLDDVGRRNAFSLPMVEEIVAAFEDLEGRDDVGAVVITGEPPAFCSGADLTHLEETGEEGLRRIYQGFLRIFRSSLPTVAAVNGAAVGAGVNLALSCDLRIAAESASFDPRFLQLGLHPGGGHTWMLDRVMGAQGAAALVLFGEVLDGRMAERHGLAWRCVRDEELLPVARTLAGRAASVPRELLRRTRRTLRSVPAWPQIGEAVEHELEQQYWSVQQPAFAERLAKVRQRMRDKS